MDHLISTSLSSQDLFVLVLFAAASIAEIFTINYPDRRAVASGWVFAFVAGSVLGPVPAAVMAGGARLVGTLGQRLGWRRAVTPPLYGLAVLLASTIVRASGTLDVDPAVGAILSSSLFSLIYTAALLAAGKTAEFVFHRRQDVPYTDSLTNILLIPVAVVLLAAYGRGGANGAMLVTGAFVALLLVVRSSVNLTTAYGELRQVHERMDEQQGKLEVALDLNREYSQIIGHDLRGPLTSVMGHAQLLTRDAERGAVDRPTLVRHVERIVHNAQRMARLIDNLQALNLDQQAAPLTERALVEPAALLQSVVTELRPGAEDRHTKLDIQITSGLPRFVTSQWMLRQIMDNLISNAIKYSEEDGHVRVELGQVDRGLRIRVQDDGIGMSDEEQARLFTRFFRSSSPRVQSVAGTGLGLALTRGMVERLGGRIEVVSQLGRGSTFSVFLPLDPEVESRCA